MVKKHLSLCFVLLALILSLPTMGTESMPMDQSVDQFYINYRHPVIQQGRFLLGTIVVRNNNPNGFSLKLSSDNNSLLTDSTSFPNGSLIPYSISIEENNGDIGAGVAKGYLGNPKQQLVADWMLLSSTSQTSYTDISLNIYIHIDQAISDRLLAGDYLDEINVHYENHSNVI
jgi:hypothetical protein|tara:strand:- start:4409 stop:4927 length:519 start_codon:yes stop_codon:yes gene_type:complete